MEHPADFSKCVFFRQQDCVCGASHEAWLASKIEFDAKDLAAIVQAIEVVRDRMGWSIATAPDWQKTLTKAQTQLEQRWPGEARRQALAKEYLAAGAEVSDPAERAALAKEYRRKVEEGSGA